MTEWTHVGRAESGEEIFWTPLRVDVELAPDDVFAALAGTTHLTGGVIDAHGGARFQLPDGGRVWISREALDATAREPRKGSTP
jgi:hypothetical protein